LINLIRVITDYEHYLPNMLGLKIKSPRTFNQAFMLALLFGIGYLIAICVNLAPITAQPKPITQAQIAEIVAGDQVYIQRQQAQEKDIAKQKEWVTTGKARAELEFNNKAIARLGNDSALMVGGCGAELTKGRVLINGAVSGCTSTISAGVRGTTYLLSIDEEGDEQIRVLEGEVEVISRPRPGEPDTGVIRELVSSGRIFSISPRTRKFALRNLSEDEYRAIVEGNLFKGYRRELASLAKIRQTYRNRFPDAELPRQLQNPKKFIRWQRRIGR
jgi:hypothetical protein